MVFNGTPRAKGLPQILFNDATGVSLPGAFSSWKFHVPAEILLNPAR